MTTHEEADLGSSTGGMTRTDPGWRIGETAEWEEVWLNPWATPVPNVLLTGPPGQFKAFVAQCILAQHLDAGGLAVVIDPMEEFTAMRNQYCSVEIASSSNEFLELALGASIENWGSNGVQLAVITIPCQSKLGLTACMDQAIDVGRRILTEHGGVLVAGETYSGRRTASSPFSYNALAATSVGICHLVLATQLRDLQFEDEPDSLFRRRLANSFGTRGLISGRGSYGDRTVGFLEPADEADSALLTDPLSALWVTTGRGQQIIRTVRGCTRRSGRGSGR